MNDQKHDRNLVAEFFASVVWEGIKSLLGASLIAAAAWILAKGRSTFPALIQNHSTGVGIALGTLGSLILLKVYFGYKYHEALPKVQHDFEEVSRSISFQYLDIHHITYIKEIVLRARRQGLSSYIDKFRWTGESVPEIRSDIRGQTVRLTHQKSVWQFYQIDFDRSLNKGEAVTTRLIFHIVDQTHSFHPFISTNIEEPTKHLALELRVPPELGVTYVTCEISSCIGARVPFFTKTISVDTNGVARWEEIPKMHHYYEMQWQSPIKEVYDPATSRAHAGSN